MRKSDSNNESAPETQDWQECVNRVGAHLGVNLTVRSGRCALTADGKTAVCCLIRQAIPGKRFLWTVRPPQLDELDRAERAYFALVCGSPQEILLIPLADVENMLLHLNNSACHGKACWYLYATRGTGTWRVPVAAKRRRNNWYAHAASELQDERPSFTPDGKAFDVGSYLI